MTFPVGWYPDPDDPSARRYWDGRSWSAPLPKDQPGPEQVHTERAPATCAVAPCTELRAAASQFCARHGRGRNSLASIPPGPTAPAPPPPREYQPFVGVLRPSGRQAIVCPHCGTQRRVTTRQVKQKKGISGGKATGAVLTGGLSMLATGLSRKERATQLHCGNCGMTWQV